MKNTKDPVTWKDLVIYSTGLLLVGHEVSDEIDPSVFESDEAYAKACQEAEEREVGYSFNGSC